MSERVLVNFFVLQETPNMHNINSVQELVDQLVGVLGSQLHSTVFPAAVADGLSMGCLVNAHSSVTCDALALPVNLSPHHVALSITCMALFLEVQVQTFETLFEVLLPGCELLYRLMLVTTWSSWTSMASGVVPAEHSTPK
jgi:hypothetical protein